MSAQYMQPQRPRKFKSFRTIGALMLREMATTYGASPGGYLWALLVPVGGILLLSFVFGLILRSPSLGTSFALFKASGLLVFLMFTDVSNSVASSIRFSKPLLFYPAVKYTDAMIARFLLNTLTQLMIFCILMTGIILIFELRLILRLEAMVLAFSMTAALALGIGALNCYLFTAFPVWERAWQILTRPLLIISGVLFIYEDAPRGLQEYLWYNPIIHLTGEMRRGFYGYYDPTYISPLFVFGISIICLTLGLLLLRKHHIGLLNNL
jgi:capsular polysaccharide transport system permease protein